MSLEAVIFALRLAAFLDANSRCMLRGWMTDSN